jgi:hypothetical protein
MKPKEHVLISEGELVARLARERDEFKATAEHAAEELRRLRDRAENVLPALPSAYKQHGGEDSIVRPDGRHPDFIIRDFFKGSDWEERIEEMIEESLREKR